MSNLTESKLHSEIALDIQPNQPAYLDTYAEVHFALGDRKNAVKISNNALNSTITRGAEYRRRNSLQKQHDDVAAMYWDLTHQHEHFMNSPLPASTVHN